MKKIKLLIFILISLLCNAQAQTYIKYGDKTFGGNRGELNVNIIYAGNNQLILVGWSQTNINGDKTEPQCDSTVFNASDIWLLKMDTAFNILWNRSLGGANGEELPRLLMQTNTGNIILSCVSGSDSACEKSEHNRGTPQPSLDYWICALNANGNKIWDKTLGGDNGEFSPQIIELASGNFIVGGASQSPVSGDKTVANYGLTDYWVVKLDSSGNKLWDKVYGGTGHESGSSSGGIPDQYFSSLLACANDNFILAGTTNSPLSGTISDTSRGFSDVWIIKIDSAGNKIWDRRYGGSGNDGCEHIISTKDNGYIICGSTDSPQGGDVSDTAKGMRDCWVIKLDSMGNKQWDKRYGGQFTIGQWIEQAPGGGYWVSGYVGGPSGIDVTDPPYGTSGDYWIFKIDSVGNKLWDKRFGGPSVNAGSRFVVMPDSSIFLAGWADQGTNAVKTDNGKGLEDYWVVHFKYTDSGTGINENLNASNFYSIFPNPSNGIIKLNSKNTGKAVISVCNLLGEKVYETKALLQKQNTFNFSFLNKAMYFIKIQTEKNTGTLKFIKE